MFRILVIETGEYLYVYKDNPAPLYTLFEASHYNHDLKKYHVYKTKTKQECLDRLERSDANYRINSEQQIDYRKNKEIFEIVEVD